MMPGLYPDLDIEAYHGGLGISKTGLDDIARSPAIYRALHLDPMRPPRAAKAGQLEGSLAHCAILEPDQLLARYAVGPAVNRNTKAWKEFVESTDRIAIQPDQLAVAFDQCFSVRDLPEVSAALERGAAEQSAYWVDEATGVLCRCRPDWTHEASDSSVILLDVKTVSDASPREFARQVARKGYAKQAAFYTDGFAAATGKKVLAFIFVAVEMAWPHAASACMLDEPSLDAGRRAYRRDLDTYAECLRTDTWPGFSSAIELISLPAWALNDPASTT